MEKKEPGIFKDDDFVDDLFESEDGDQALATYGFSSIESSLEKKKKEREEKQKNAKDSEGKATLQVTKVIVAKQRNGETGEFKVGYNATTTSFENVVQDAYFVEPTPPEKRGYEKK